MKRKKTRAAFIARANGDVPIRNGRVTSKYFLVRLSDDRGLAYGVSRESLQGLQKFLESGGTACEICHQSSSKGYYYRIDGTRAEKKAAA